MYEKGRARPTHTPSRSRDITAAGIPHTTNHRSSLSASGALMSTHRAIIQASYRTLRPAAESRSPAVAGSGKILQSTTCVPKNSPSLCLPGHPSRSAARPYMHLDTALLGMCQPSADSNDRGPLLGIFQGVTTCLTMVRTAFEAFPSQCSQPSAAVQPFLLTRSPQCQPLPFSPSQKQIAATSLPMHDMRFYTRHRHGVRLQVDASIYSQPGPPFALSIRSQSYNSHADLHSCLWESPQHPSVTPLVLGPR